MLLQSREQSTTGSVEPVSPILCMPMQLVGAHFVRTRANSISYSVRTVKLRRSSAALTYPTAGGIVVLQAWASALYVTRTP